MKTKSIFFKIVAIIVILFFNLSMFSQTQKSNSEMKTKTVVFITGAFVGSNCWDEWKTYFESKGYKVIVPDYPYKDADPATLRSRKPNSALAGLTLEQLTAYYEKIIREQPEKPILIGHSLGGLLTQILVHKNIAAAGIAIHSAPPKGILLSKWSSIKSIWSALSIFKTSKETYMMSFKDWQYAFTNGMTELEQKTAYEKYATPESVRLIRGGLTNAAKVDFKKHHDPLLIVSGDKDHFFPPSINYKNYKKYRKNSNSITDYKEFKGRNHYVLGLPTWKENADYILNWMSNY
jgi:pimeloyl-ACP methyl ester carboxylesterase